MEIERKHPLAKCEECPLFAQPMVPAYGPQDARVVIVGEAPGANEAEIGRPFVGDSGKLLRGVLTRHGVDDSEVYFTNVCLCRPPDNKTPKKKEIAACLPRLKAELESLSADTVFAVGGVAGKTLLQSTEGITKLRLGGPQRSAISEHTVVPTFHPAAALRNPDHLPSIYKDIGRALEGRASIKWQPTEYSVHERPGDAREVLERYHDTIAVDVEVCSTDEQSHGSPHDFKFLCIGVSDVPGKADVFTEEVLRDNGVREAFRDMLMRTTGSYHNGKFDIQYLRAYFGAGSVGEDTMLLHYSCDERVGTHDLEQVVVDELNAPRFKSEAKAELPEDERSLAFLPKDVLYKYNAYDVDHTHRLIEPLTARMRREGTEDPYRNFLIPMSDIVADMEYQGLHVNEAGLDAIEDEFTNALTEMRIYFDENEINPNSPTQVKKALAEFGFNVVDTKKQTLQYINHEFVDKLLAYKTRHKIQSTYVHRLQGLLRNGKVHPQYKLHGTETGRLSSKAPNIQNQPHEYGIRDLFVPAPGKVFVYADFSGIELRLAGIFAEDPYLCRAFREGRNPHRELASKLFGDDYSTRQYVTTKSVNFGALYRESAYHLAYRLKITEDEAKKIQTEFFRRSPALLQYHRKLEKEIHKNGYIRSMFGRKRRFWLLTDRNKHDVHKEGYNFPIQSAASDITVDSIIKITRELQGIARPAITVHDSITMECNDDHETIMHVAKTMKECMEREISGVPITAEFAYGHKWGSLKELEV